VHGGGAHRSRVTPRGGNKQQGIACLVKPAGPAAYPRVETDASLITRVPPELNRRGEITALPEVAVGFLPFTPRKPPGVLPGHVFRAALPVFGIEHFGDFQRHGVTPGGPRICLALRIQAAGCTPGLNIIGPAVYISPDHLHVPWFAHAVADAHLSQRRVGKPVL